MPFIEIPTIKYGSQIVASTIREATPQEVARAAKLAEEGCCPHDIVEDRPGFAYSSRYCVTCGTFIGLI